MTTLLDEDGGVHFLLNRQVRSKALCPDPTGAPASVVQVHDWPVEETVLQWIAPHRRVTAVDPRCQGRPTHLPAAGRPDLRLHDLRHTGATLAAVSGATLAELMARLGHSTPGAAMRYQHAAADRDKVIAAALSKLATGDVTPIEQAGTKTTTRNTG
jgi:hypothetical protein